MHKEKSESWVKGYAIGKKIKDSVYPVVIDDFIGDRDDFLRGMAFAGFHGEVRFSE